MGFGLEPGMRNLKLETEALPTMSGRDVVVGNCTGWNPHSGRGPAMSRLTALGRILARPILRISDIDLRLARLRLRDFGVRHAELTALFSLDDSPGPPSERLIELLLALVARARSISLSDLNDRNPPELLHVWPGEHYRLLAALVQELRPRNVLEIGTFTGLSALAMLSYLPRDAQLTTVDIISWDKICGTFLRPTDFATGNFRQIVCDLRDPANCRVHTQLLQSADIIFIDGPKDGVFEPRLLENLSLIGLPRGPLLIFDDIRIWNMLATWRRIRYPKLDVTSIGHHTGTGLVEWAPF